MLNRSSIARTLLKQATTSAPRSAVALGPRAAAAFSTSSVAARPDVKMMGVAMANELAKNPDYKPERKIFNEFSLEGRVAAVTGGNSGIGLEGAMGLIEQGAKEVYVLDMADKPSADFLDCAALAEKFGGKLSYHQCNVTDPEAVDAIFVGIEKDHNRLDVLFAAAGILGLPEGHGCEDYPPEVFNKVLAVNTSGVFYCAQAAARVMKRTHSPGSIVLVASMSGSVTNRGERWTPYNVSKAGVIQMARSMACELGPDNIRVNSISPGHIYTKLTAALLDNHPEYDDKWSALNPMGRIGAVHELRGALAWLSSDASSYATGSDVLVCGGHTSW